jgi:hypothetical protein
MCSLIDQPTQRREKQSMGGRPTETVILDTTARAFIAVTGMVDEHGTMDGTGTHAGPLPLLKRIARLIAENEQLAS